MMDPAAAAFMAQQAAREAERAAAAAAQAQRAREGEEAQRAAQEAEQAADAAREAQRAREASEAEDAATRARLAAGEAEKADLARQARETAEVQKAEQLAREAATYGLSVEELHGQPPALVRAQRQAQEAAAAHAAHAAQRQARERAPATPEPTQTRRRDRASSEARPPAPPPQAHREALLQEPAEGGPSQRTRAKTIPSSFPSQRGSATGGSTNQSVLARGLGALGDLLAFALGSALILGLVAGAGYGAIKLIQHLSETDQVSFRKRIPATIRKDCREEQSPDADYQAEPHRYVCEGRSLRRRDVAWAEFNYFEDGACCNSGLSHDVVDDIGCGPKFDVKGRPVAEVRFCSNKAVWVVPWNYWARVIGPGAEAMARESLGGRDLTLR